MYYIIYTSKEAGLRWFLESSKDSANVRLLQLAKPHQRAYITGSATPEENSRHVKPWKVHRPSRNLRRQIETLPRDGIDISLYIQFRGETNGR